MEKKNWINIMFFVFIFILFLIISCDNKSGLPGHGILLKTDREFSEKSLNDGMHAAFLSYVADSGVLLRNDAYPLRGKNALEDLFAERSDSSFVLTWEPLFEKLSGSGDLGYTYGIYSSRSKTTDEVSRGIYLTIWEKQPDGSWKFVLDVGTQGLPEKDE